ncbi:hypothetical protein [Stenotrophomonas maltophilia]|uniref:hypothetical protein n=1 Tax=Stenotrophomonas maltophilia TaxID=40324 RepID=UPI00117CAF41|nr:hypothetical protein [Stenotrophomonas maltophilia]
MTESKRSMADTARALFEANAGLVVTSAQASDAAGVQGWKKRQAMRRTLHDLVDAGYLAKTGIGEVATFQATGNGMRRKFRTPEERVERAREISRASKARARAARLAAEPRVDRMTINRARVAQRAGLAPAKAWGKEADGRILAETVEQFQARGGQVQRLTASWEQRA